MNGQRYTYFDQLSVDYIWRSDARTITETDIVNFSNLSGDFNRIHVDAEFAKSSPYGQRVAHGLLGLSIASGLQTSEPPWDVQAFMGLEWKFSKPIFIGDTIYYQSKILKLKDLGKKGAGVAKIERKLINQNEQTVQLGIWTLLIGKEKKDS